MKNPTPKPTAKRTPGRPRNPELDKLQRELAISRRHASNLLKEQAVATAVNSENPMTPLAQARLTKTLSEIRLLQTKIRTAELEERALEGELLYLSEAQELVLSVTSAIANSLRGMPKTLSARLLNQPTSAIEKTLLDFCDSTLAQCASAVAKVAGDRKL